ncbi:MAG: tetratricopeptide repeat protein [Candidatus Omnitrophica bacterium]|nr:tetratricopeptide repeat protein [Candidatus Omnitrophota bacterium]
MPTNQKIITVLITAFILVSGAIVVSAEEDASTLSSLGEACRKEGDYKKALKYLDKAISIDPKYPMAYMYKGKVYFSMQKFEEVGEEFDLFRENMRPLAANDDIKQFYIESLHDICAIYFELKKYERARAILDEILKLSPKDQVAIYNSGIYYYVYERNRSSAYNLFSKAIEIDPTTHTAAKAKYAIEFMRANSDPRMEPDFSFIDQEYRD